jgi:hypothetical protein
LLVLANLYIIVVGGQCCYVGVGVGADFEFWLCRVVLSGWQVVDVGYLGIHNWYMKSHHVTFIAHLYVLECNMLVVHP